MELGTGLGHGTAWILDGMDANARLVSVDREERCVTYAREHIDDARAEFIVDDAGAFLRRTTDRFDLVFADAYPGKIFDLELAVAVVAVGGFYVVDDMTPLPHWSAEHRRSIEDVTARLERVEGLTVVKLSWATGLVLAVKGAGGEPRAAC
ncbi:MAG: class I SAM-dependent methyltransferase [Myxococcales bacterium]|nr:class I SAM-dependent methyltransferase [Myxococcales bacterium]